MAKPKIGIVVGSTRPNRFADKPTEWIEKIAKARGDIEVEVVDLRDFPLPFFNEPVSPAWGASQDETAQKWQKKVAEFDGFIFITAEYNRGPTAVLKNAITSLIGMDAASVCTGFAITFSTRVCRNGSIEYSREI